MEKNETKKQTSQEWEIARYNRERDKWAARQGRWNAWKKCYQFDTGAILVCNNTLSK